MKLRFILPCVGRKRGMAYVRSWLMEPLAIAALSAHTPKSVQQAFTDDRLERIPYDAPADLVAINVETYTARRAYQIARRFRERGVPVVMGGFHATLMPDEVARHADAVVIGQAESVWPAVVEDAFQGRLKSRYVGAQGFNSPEIIAPNRAIYADNLRRYTRITLIETGRGCPNRCEFCSVSSFFGHRYHARPIDAVVREIKALNARTVFFVDDNFAADKARTVELCKAVERLRIRWVGQASIDAARSDELLRRMRRSGCAGLLIGFESLSPDHLATMGKGVNRGAVDYAEAVSRIRAHGMMVYGTFLFGYDGDTAETFEATLRFAVRNKLFFAAFNHLVPFPGTALYERLKAENRLIDDPWWLSERFRFGDLYFHPKNISAKTLADLCYRYRRKFYGLRSLVRRFDAPFYARNPDMGLTYLVQNLGSLRDVFARQGLPFGVEE